MSYCLTLDFGRFMCSIRVQYINLYRNRNERNETWFHRCILPASRRLTCPRAATCRLILSLLLAPTNMSPRDGEADRIASAQQTLDGMLRFQFLFSCMHREPGSFKVLYDMSQLFGTQLDKETLATCIGMIESGVNPEALAVSV